MLKPAIEEPYNQLKIKFENGQYFIYKIDSTLDLTIHKMSTPVYINHARVILKLPFEIKPQHIMPLRINDDEN